MIKVTLRLTKKSSILMALPLDNIRSYENNLGQIIAEGEYLGRKRVLRNIHQELLTKAEQAGIDLTNVLIYVV